MFDNKLKMCSNRHNAELVFLHFRCVVWFWERQSDWAVNSL